MMVLGLLTAVGQGCIPLIEIIVPSETVPMSMVSTVTASLQLIVELIGGTLMPSIAGIAAVAHGLAAPLWIAVSASFVAMIVAFGLKETAPRKVGANGSPANTIADAE